MFSGRPSIQTLQPEGRYYCHYHPLNHQSSLLDAFIPYHDLFKAVFRRLVLSTQYRILPFGEEREPHRSYARAPHSLPAPTLALLLTSSFSVILTKILTSEGRVFD